MATMKTFEVAGVSTFKGVTKVRFANDYVGRFKILAKNDHTNIELIELGEKMSKEDICKVLMAHPKFQNEAAQTAIAEFVVRNVKSIKPQQKETEQEVSEQPAEAEQFEDAPF